jgi:bifunctional enzyme CysN/CysC
MPYDARDSSPKRASANLAQTALGITRFVLCGDAGAGKGALIERLRREASPGPAEQLLLHASYPAAVSSAFSTARSAYIGIGALEHAHGAAGMLLAAADLALVVIDASTGAGARSRRQTCLAVLVGIPHVVVAVNRMDVIRYAQKGFDQIERDVNDFSAKVGLSGLACVPVSALQGDNVATRSSRTAWYRGPTLVEALDSVCARGRKERPLRLPVERVEDTQPGTCAVMGTVASGNIRRGQRIRVQPSGYESTVARIVTAGGDNDEAFADQAVALTLADEVEIVRGDVVCAIDSPALVADQFEATIVWTNEQPLLRGRSYLMQCATNTVHATVAPLKHKINIDTLEKVAASKLELDEIGTVALELDRPIAFDPYRENRITGGFVLIDRIDQAMMGAGMLRFALRRADNVHWQALEVDKLARQALAGHRSGVIWMTGLSGAGKSTLANMLEKRLHARGLRTYLLDGDNVRHGLNKDLGFTAADRVENIRRIAEVARLMADAGIIVITAFISPFRAERSMARELMQPGEFVEVFVDTPLEVAESRDPKGLYGKARRGELKNFTGIDSPYEAPEKPEVRIDTVLCSVEDATQQIYDVLIRTGMIDRE